MAKPATATMAPSQLRAARRALLETGELRLALPDPGLSRSWLRSHAAGLSPVGRPPGAPHASSAQLHRALERQHELVAHARPVMQDLFAQTRESDGMVILSDGQGLLLQALGDGRFVDRAQRVALRPGAIWDERWRGTNAIGTALVERRPVAVLGGEHYLERNGFLSCTAAPIRDPQGRVLGVLDISGDQRGFHRHTLALVRMAARAVEHRLFETRHADCLRLRLHPQREGLGTPGEGLIAVSEDGWIVGGNETALTWLGAEAARSPRVEAVLPLEWPSLLGWACGEDGAPWLMRRDDEPAALWLRATVPQAWRRRVVAVRPVKAGADAAGASVRPPGLSGALFSAVSMADGSALEPAPAPTGTNARPAPSAPPTGTRTDTHIDRHIGTRVDTRMAQAASATEAAPLPTLQTAPDDALAALDAGDPVMSHLLHRLRKVLDKPIALLLQGESGVGKDLLARAVHDSGGRREGAYVAVNCAALPEGLIEAELFGYRGGAFTGAAREGAPGRLRQAHGGTLFLDEIGDMPMAMQARLLRVLQDRQVQPLGGGATVTVDLQLICASHRPLRALVDEGRFREDLYYRINGLTLTVPPLRSRTDLGHLVARLLASLAPERALSLAPEVMAGFQAYGWPGNIRQLEQALRVAVAMLDAEETEIGRGHLPEDLQEALDGCRGASVCGARADGMARRPLSGTVSTPGLTPGAPAHPLPLATSPMRPVPQAVPAASDPGHALGGNIHALREHARAHARQVLTDCGGNVSEAARRLGVGRNTLYRMLR